MPPDLPGLRSEFPLLARPTHGRPLIYLDSAATSQKPRAVIEAEERFYEQRNANVHRGAYALAEEATDAYEGARARMARFVHASRPEEIVFTRGTTESLNLVAAVLGRARLRTGDRVVVTEMDHHSNIIPWHLLRTYGGIDLAFVPVDAQGRIGTEALSPYLEDGRTRVVAFPHVSNVLGTVAPVREIARAAHAAGALVVLDAAQSAPHLPLEVHDLGVDFVAFSGHKMLGPTGIGVLWGRFELLETLPPWMGGGQMIEEVSTDRITYREPPARFEAGTPNIAGAVGLAAAADFLEAIGWAALSERDRALRHLFFDLVRDRLPEDLTVYGPGDEPDRLAVLSFTLRGIHAHDIASLLDAEGIAIRAGQHCSQILMRRFGVPAMARASPYLYNTEPEIEALVDTLVRIRDRFRGA
ncbi:MAG: SufS family cysteine desulfurase [Thermoplasmata archaeon]